MGLPREQAGSKSWPFEQQYGLSGRTRSTMHYLDIDGAYLAQPYMPARERAEIRRWERVHGAPWDLPADEIMLGEMPIGEAITNHGCGPSLGDLARVGHFEEAL